MRPRTLAPLAVASLALAATFSCTRPEDRAAKQRIFSPEEPVGAKAGAAEKLDATRLADDVALARRVLRMERAEIAHRLGSYKAQLKVTFVWTRGPVPDGGAPEVQLAEESSIVQAAKGAFQTKFSTDRISGWELVRTDGVYLRNLPGPFRKRRTDRSDAEALRETAFAGLGTFDRLARGLKLRLEGTSSPTGRPLVRYSVTSGGAQPQAADARDLPPIVYPEAPAGQPSKALGPDPDTARRLDFLERVQPFALSGTVTVDAATAAPLSADLTGTFRVASARADAEPANLELKLLLSTGEVGGTFEVKTPKWEEDPSTPHAVKDPLRFWGKPGAPGAASTAEPVEDDEPDVPELPPKPDEKVRGDTERR